MMYLDWYSHTSISNGDANTWSNTPFLRMRHGVHLSFLYCFVRFLDSRAGRDRKVDCRVELQGQHKVEVRKLRPCLHDIII